MRARAEIGGYRPQPHVPTRFQSIAQGAEARRLQVDAFRQAQEDFARDGLVLVEPSHHRLPMSVVNVASALGLLAVACAPQPVQGGQGSEVVVPGVLKGAPISGDASRPQVIATLPPGSMATAEAREEQARATAEAASKPPEKPAEPKPLPPVINAETVKFAELSPAEAQEQLDRAKAEGKPKLTSPDVLKQKGVSLVEVHNNNGETAFAITVSAEGTYYFPALSKGKVTQILKGTPSGIVFDGDLMYGYIIPKLTAGQTELTVNSGDSVIVGQPVVSVTYNPNSDIGRGFIKTLAAQAPDAPPNTIAIIGGKTGTSLTRDDLLTTIAGSLVTAGPMGKGG